MENTVYLLKVDPGANNNKFYTMIPDSEEMFHAEYGRVGLSKQVATYPMTKWNAKYREKLRKGYRDQTDLHSSQISVVGGKGKYETIAEAAIREIVERLQAMAKKVIKENYTVSSDAVTDRMVQEAQRLLDELVKITDVYDFNRKLVELFNTIPRFMTYVASYIAGDTGDFRKIIQREQDLLDTMRTQVQDREVMEVPSGGETGKTILEAHGLRFQETKDSDVQRIMRHLGDLKGQFKNAWCVENIKTQKAFDAYLEENQIDGQRPDVKLYWHGSKNGYWWSIINDGLLLRPTGVVTNGNMFGHGLYFANKAGKSRGYTSLDGAYWTRGTERFGFMALYAVAYGKPYHVYDFDPRYQDFNYQALRRACPQANCLHAHAGSALRNDEIIVYSESQATIKYLVELKAA